MLTAIAGGCPPRLNETKASRGFTGTNITMANFFTDIVTGSEFLASIDKIWNLDLAPI